MEKVIFLTSTRGDPVSYVELHLKLMNGIQSNSSMKEVTYKYCKEEVDAHTHTQIQ